MCILFLYFLFSDLEDLVRKMLDCPNSSNGIQMLSKDDFIKRISKYIRSIRHEAYKPTGLDNVSSKHVRNMSVDSSRSFTTCNDLNKTKDEE